MKMEVQVPVKKTPLEWVALAVAVVTLLTAV